MAKNITTNEMIFATLKTKTDKNPKYAEQLREMGYEVSDTDSRYLNVSGNVYKREYWSVNGLELSKPDNGAIYLNLRRACVEKLDNIKRVDFVNYLATLEARKAKQVAMDAKGNIWQDIYYHAHKQRVCVNPDEHRWSKRIYKTIKNRYTTFSEGNKTITEYKYLKDKSTGDRGYWGKWNEIEYAERRVAEAKAKVEKAMRELERAQEQLAKEKCKVAEGNAELNAFLRDKGIRK